MTTRDKVIVGLSMLVQFVTGPVLLAQGPEPGAPGSPMVGVMQQVTTPSAPQPTTVQTVMPANRPNWTPAVIANPIVSKRGGPAVTITAIASVDYTPSLLSGCTVDLQVVAGDTKVTVLTGKTGPDGQAKFQYAVPKNGYAGTYYYKAAMTCNGKVLSDDPNYGGLGSAYKVFVVQ